MCLNPELSEDSTLGFHSLPALMRTLQNGTAALWLLPSVFLIHVLYVFNTAISWFHPCPIRYICTRNIVQILQYVDER